MSISSVWIFIKSRWFEAALLSILGIAAVNNIANYRQAAEYAAEAAESAEQAHRCVVAWHNVYYSTSLDRDYKSIEEFKAAREPLLDEMDKACGTNEDDR